jgi:acetylornithine deacetylase/succinyl-diaminopimelate desuccinylase-like protein
MAFNSAVVLATAPASLRAQATPAVAAYVQAHRAEILRELVDLLRIPNVARDTAGISANARAIAVMMERRGLAPRILESPVAGGRPAVYGEWRVPGATRTLLLYAHYDGQPTDPRDWTGSGPWEPTLRAGTLDSGAGVLPLPGPGDSISPDWRVYARSASDDKAGVIAILSAIDALRGAGLRPTSNLKIFFEGEEEAGSPFLAQMLRANADLLRSDAWIIADGPVHQSGRPQVVYGVRGDMNVDLTVYGPLRPLHSGHYGNWAPNPALDLSRLLAGMKDEQGRVLIAGWYDDVTPLGPEEREALKALPSPEAELQRTLGIARPEGNGASLAERISLPSLNINGIRSADAGEGARNVIPTQAIATLDLRLVKGNDVQRQFGRLAEHIRRQGYLVLDREPTMDERRANAHIARLTLKPGAYNAQRTPMSLPLAAAVAEAVQSVSPQPIVRLPTLGGSLPLSVIEETLGAPTLTVPIANYDNNQHAENENLRLGNLWAGIEIYAAIMRAK